jgi:serine/threonine protein kinase
MAIHCPKCTTENPSDSKFCKECATPLLTEVEAQISFTKTLLTPVEDLTRGTLFAGRYEIIEELGKDAISIAKQICEGLAEAHRLGVVHRDLKPQNIMFDQESQAKIMDFGISRSVEAKGVTVTGLIIGTPDYISPEQAEGEEADHRSDIYSLGKIPCQENFWAQFLHGFRLLIDMGSVPQTVRLRSGEIHNPAAKAIKETVLFIPFSGFF